MRTLRIGVLLIALFTTLAANAQEDAVAAEALFDQGRKAMESEDYETARARFAESQRLEPAVGTLLNLAVCEEKLGKLASAWQHWRESLDALPVNDDRRAFARERLDALQPRLPYLTLVPPPGANEPYQVLRDGIQLGRASLGIELPVDPGSHEIVVRAPGREEFKAEFELAEQEHKVFELALGRAQPKPAARAAPPPPQSSPAAPSLREKPRVNGRRTAGIVVGSAGLLSIGAAVGTGLMVAEKKRTVEDNCDAGKRCNQTGIDAANSGRTLLGVNALCWGVGIAWVAAGSVLIATGRGRPSSPHGESASPKQVSLALAPTPGGATLALRGLLP